MMKVLDELNRINRMVESELVLELSDEDFADGRAEIEHIYLHEACHAAVAHCVPWIRTLDAAEHTAVDELMARFLELAFGAMLGLPVHSNAEFLEELQLYPVEITPEGLDHLLGVWESYFWPNKDLAGMAAYILTFHRHQQVIYHILPAADWAAAQRAGVYSPASLAAEGFIHCSKVDQVVRSAQLYFAGQQELQRLCIASEKVRAEIRYEDLLGAGQQFPHIYGPLNLDAVVEVSTLAQNHAGEFVLTGDGDED